MDVSWSFLQYFFSQAYITFMLSMNSSTNLFLTIFGAHISGINIPIHSSVVLFPPNSLFFESFIFVIKWNGHFRPPAKKILFPLKPIEATPLSFGIDKFLQIFPSHVKDAPAASEIKQIDFTGGDKGGFGIGRPFSEVFRHFFQIQRSFFRFSVMIRFSDSLFSKFPKSLTKWNRKPIINSHICEKSLSFPCNCCTILRLHVLEFRNTSIIFTMPSYFSFVIDHVKVSVSKFIPNIVPLVEGPKAFSFLGHGSAKGMLNFCKLRRILVKIF